MPSDSSPSFGALDPKIEGDLRPSLAEAVPVQIWTALADGNLDYVTDQTAQALGLTAAELLAEGWQKVVHPEDLPGVVERWVHSLTTGDAYDIEFRLRLADGRYALHLVRAVAQRDSAGTILRWFGSNTNIEDQNEQRRRMRALNEEVLETNRLLALEAEVGNALTRSRSKGESLSQCAEALVRHLDASFVRIWTLDRTGKVLELQASAGLYTHLDGPHARVPVGALKIGLIASERKAHLTNQVVGDPRVTDQAWAVREGMVAFAGYPLVLGDELVGVVAAFAKHPLTHATFSAIESVANGLALAIERMRGEEERTRLLDLERTARERAEFASRSKDEFLATASHELRTPLNAILGWARLLRTGSLDTAANGRALEIIERNAKAQVQLIEDILDGSRIITGKLHLEVRPIDLVETVKSALDSVRPAATAKAITLTAELDPAAAPIDADPDRVQQIVWNLVNNAIKFTPKGGKISVLLSRVSSAIELQVTDTGKGISADFLPHVFERFRQADATTTRRHGGLGLGLALVRHLAEAHGGVVRAESSGEGAGSTFVVVLPVKAVEREAGAATQEPLSDVGSTASADIDLSGIRVVVVDDEADARDLVATVLESRGASVVVATTAAEALANVEWTSPDVLVSDIGMPGTDGFSLIKSLRALTNDVSKTPAIALTAYALDADRRRALVAGFQTFLSKPVHPDELVAKVFELARAREARRA